MIKLESATVIQEASSLLKQGDVVAFPTETVYGLGADAHQESAICKIFSIKNRPSFNPLIVHVLDINQAETIGMIPKSAYPLLEHYWPGPLTIVVPKNPKASLAPSITAGLDTVALRVPAHPTFRRLLTIHQAPIAAPSANASNKLSCTTASHVLASLKSRAPLIIKSTTPCAHGLESTIIDFSTKQPTLLRHGALPLEIIENLLGPVVLGNHKKTIKAPGQLNKHYAPDLPLRLNASSPRAKEAYLNFGPPKAEETLNLSPNGDLEEAACNLFVMLHRLDIPEHYSGIAVAPIPLRGLGKAINDRLNRASYKENTPS